MESTLVFLGYLRVSPVTCLSGNSRSWLYQELHGHSLLTKEPSQKAPKGIVANTNAKEKKITVFVPQLYGSCIVHTYRKDACNAHSKRNKNLLGSGFYNELQEISGRMSCL